MMKLASEEPIHHPSENALLRLVIENRKERTMAGTSFLIALFAALIVVTVTAILKNL
jgi:hypothetical protein